MRISAIKFLEELYNSVLIIPFVIFWSWISPPDKLYNQENHKLKLMISNVCTKDTNQHQLESSDGSNVCTEDNNQHHLESSDRSSVCTEDENQHPLQSSNDSSVCKENENQYQLKNSDDSDIFRDVEN